VTTASRPRAPRGRRSTRPSGDEREQAILATAQRLLEERGLADISVDDLARGAGLSRPTFYFYFGSKEEVLLRLIEPLIRRADTGFDGVNALPSNPRRAFLEGIRIFVTAFAGHPLTRAATEALNTNAAVRAMWTSYMQKWIDQTAALIVAERERGAAPDTLPAIELATALNHLNERAIVAAVSGERGAVAQDRLVETLAHIWITSIYGRSA
jgi:TetR/AcrR family transcriptional regulator, ethionamide resistance regulator